VKILFVDESTNLQEKWIEPLRGEGWGVVRARSTDDAEKIFEFHGDSLAGLVVSETYAEWASQWNYPYVVLMKNWKEVQVLKHQNSSNHPAIAYIDYDSNLELLKQTVVESKSKSQQGNMKSTGTSTSVRSGASASSSSSSNTSSILAALESISAQATSNAESQEDSVVISFEKYADQKIELESTSHQPAAIVSENKENTETPEKEPDQDRTMMLESAPELEVIPEEIEENSHTQTQTLTQIQEEIPETFSMELDSAEDYSIDQEPVEESSAIADSPEVIQYGSGGKDLETMKSYLALREQDVALLTGQMRSAHERVQQLEVQLKMEKARSGELQHVVQRQEQQIKNFERDKEVEFEVLYQQVEDLNLQLRERTDKVRTIEAKLKITTDEVEKVKERVRVDIRRIRVREKELESQLEVLKKDSTALLMARDEKILELKRKVDLLEFNMELVQEQYGKERNQTEQLRHKLKEAAGAMKRAGGLLEHEN
jgi:chromosome segregation ATPase